MEVTQEECDKLTRLYKQAEDTPVMALSVKDGLEGRDFASQAWNLVREYMDALAKKYNYDPQKYGINRKTREIIPIG